MKLRAPFDLSSITAKDLPDNWRDYVTPIEIATPLYPPSVTPLDEDYANWKKAQEAKEGAA